MSTNTPIMLSSEGCQGYNVYEVAHNNILVSILALCRSSISNYIEGLSVHDQDMLNLISNESLAKSKLKIYCMIAMNTS